jgi:NTE family protein
MATSVAHPAVRRAVSERTVILIASLGVFMAFIDNTIVSIAFPNMLKSFPEASLSSLSWVFNIYNIALAALLVPAGRIADIAGRKKTFVFGVAVFTLASALCAAAGSVGMLIAARGLQGAGAAVLIPASLGLILHVTPEERRTQATALWSATGALAAGIGPTIGGLLVNLQSWRLVFLINVPIGIVVWYLARRQLVESRAPGRRAAPDMLGALLLAASIGLLSLGIVEGSDWGWRSPGVILSFVGAIVAGAAVVRRTLRHSSPIIDVEMLRRRSFVAANVLTIVGSAGFYALGLANILYLMRVWGYSAFGAGLAGTPAPFIAALTAAQVGKFLAKRDPRPFIAVGGLIWALGPLVLVHQFTLTPHYLSGYFPAAVVLAIGIGVTFPLVSAIAVANPPGGRYAGATAFNSSVRQIGAALGVAILVALVGQPSPDAIETAFDRAWVFAAICFALVGIGSIALGRVASVAPAEAVAEAWREVRRHAPEPAAATTPRRPRPAAPAAAHDGAGGPKSMSELLADVPMFSALAPATRDEVAERTAAVSVPAGEWLFRQGDEADALYIVRSGRLEVVNETPGREAFAFRELRAGDAVGELALITESTRTASVRVRRDAHLLRVGRDEFEAILAESPGFSRELLRTVGGWVQPPPPDPRPNVPATIAVVALSESAAAAGIDTELAERLSDLASVSYVTRDLVGPGADPGHALSELLDRAEGDHWHVLLAGGIAGTDGWAQSCMVQADRVVLVVDEPPAAELCAGWGLPTGADVALLGGGAVDGAMKALLDELEPRVTYRLRAGAERAGDTARMARRLAGRAVGLVLSGGGARCFTQLGVIEELRDAGVQIDRVGGTSMGAFIGALVALDLTPEAVDARCYEEWVRRNPVSDYRFPRTSLIRGQRARAMLERNLPGSIEDLPRGYFSTSVDIIGARPVHHRRGELALAVGASMALPMFVEPVVLENMLLLDGGLMDNLPTEAMAMDGEGPVIGVDVSEPSMRSLAPDEQPMVPSFAETIFKVMLLSESDDTRRRSFADVLICPDFEGVGILEFHMIDHLRAAGRRAAAKSLEDAPGSIFG